MEALFKFLAPYNRREQTMLLVGSIALVLYLVWMLVLNPLANQRDKLIATNNATEQSLGRVQLLAQQIKNLAQQNTQISTSGGDLSGVVNNSLQANGLAMSGLQPGAGGEVRIRIDKASSESVMQWLYDLENKHHIVIKELSMTAGNDAGHVAVNVRLFKP